MLLNLLRKRAACRALHPYTAKRKARSVSKDGHSEDSVILKPPSLAFSDLFVESLGSKFVLTQEMKEDISVQSALCIIPPKSIWDSIQNIRKVHDPAYYRWMPHINIFFPFIDEKWFGDIAQYIGDIVHRKGIEPFEITLKEFDCFDRVNKGEVPNKYETLFLRPSGCEREMQKLWNCLKDDWPLCANKHGGGFNPHMTMAKGIASLMLYYKDTFQWQWKELSFECNELSLISRRGNDPFVVRHTIPL